MFVRFSIAPLTSARSFFRLQSFTNGIDSPLRYLDHMPNLDKLIGRQRTMSAFTVLIFSPPGQPLSNIYEMIILGSVALETRSMGPRCVAIVAAILGSSGNSDGTLNVGLVISWIHSVTRNLARFSAAMTTSCP